MASRLFVPFGILVFSVSLLLTVPGKSGNDNVKEIHLFNSHIVVRTKNADIHFVNIVMARNMQEATRILECVIASDNSLKGGTVLRDQSNYKIWELYSPDILTYKSLCK